MKFCLIVFFCFALASCSGIGPLTSKKRQYYRAEFLHTIQSIKRDFKGGKANQALSRLSTLDDKALISNERAFKRNLIGVIYFSLKKYELALKHFLEARKMMVDNPDLKSKVALNLASTYYKLKGFDQGLSSLKDVVQDTLSKTDRKKFYFLQYKLSSELGMKYVRLIALVDYFFDKTTIPEVKSDRLYDQLLKNFLLLSETERPNFIYQNFKEKSLAMAYLSYMEMESLYYGGKKGEASSLLEWLMDKYAGLGEIKVLLQDFQYRMQNYAKMDPANIGVVLPLTGSKAKFGKRVLTGIDMALKARGIVKVGGKERPYKLFVEDSRGSGVVGSYRVKNLVDKRHVSVVIGGLFSSEASKQYLEAKRLGVLFISLSPVLVPREMKNHNLIEIPGSIESQMEALFQKRFVGQFGKRGAIIYPDDPTGNAYLREFWERANVAGIEVTDIVSFKKNQHDLRGPVKKVLGLEFSRERQEELKLLGDIYSLESSSSIRRIQTLRPDIDFDWIYVAAFPRKTLQILPSFTYFDAFNLKFIGGPSWRSKLLANESYKLGRLYFIGEDVQDFDKKFAEAFEKNYKRRPRLIEVRAFDALNVYQGLIENRPLLVRQEFDRHIKNQKTLKGVTGTWQNKEGIWVKDMYTHVLSRGSISKAKFSPAVESKKAN